MVHPSPYQLPLGIISPSLRQIVALLGQDQVRLVGGAVRNALLGVPVDDIDLATVLHPEDVSARLVRAGIKVIPTGLAHGTVTAVIGSQSYEITTLRVDRTTDGRHANVEFSADWLEDARRRDFTMNALYADIDGVIYDPLGEGLRDLDARRVRFVGDPDTRIREDYLRILRFFRFTLFYGGGRCDRAGLAACSRQARGIKSLSLERVTMEMRKIVLHEQSPKILEVMFKSGVFLARWGRAFDAHVQKRIVSSDGIISSDYRFVFRLMASFGFRKSGQDILSKIMILNKKERQFYERFIFLKIDTNRIVRKKIATILMEGGRDQAGATLAALFASGRIDRTCFQSLQQDFLDRDLPQFPLRSGEIKERGYDGAALGEEINRLKRLWAGSEFTLTREGLLRKIRPVGLAKPT